MSCHALLLEIFPTQGLNPGLLNCRIRLQCRRPRFNSWIGKIRWRRDRLPTPIFLGFPCGSAGKESACNVGDLGSTPGLGRSPEEGKGYPLLYSGLENSMDCIVHGVAKSQTRLSDFRFHFIFTLYPWATGEAPKSNGFPELDYMLQHCAKLWTEIKIIKRTVNSMTGRIYLLIPEFPWLRTWGNTQCVLIHYFLNKQMSSWFCKNNTIMVHLLICYEDHGHVLQMDFMLHYQQNRN